MIITGGVNVYPQEAENVLALHPKVNDVAVFGVPNDDFGEEVKAVVEPVSMDDAGPDLERELIAYCKEHLADVKCPRSVDFRAELPRHPTGKLYKRLLKDEYWAAAGPVHLRRRCPPTPPTRSWTGRARSPSPTAAGRARRPRTRCRPSSTPCGSATGTSRPTPTSPPTAC